MRTPSRRSWILALLCGVGLSISAQALLPDVQERILKNGVRVLLVDRPGTNAVHAQCFLRGGSADTGRLSPLAAELLARSFNEPSSHGVWTEMEALLKQEEGSYESLRLDRLRKSRSGIVDASMETQGLEVLHQQAQERIRALAQQVKRQDPLDAMGAVNRASDVTADFLSWGADLPKGALDAWCNLQAEQLRNPHLSWFSLDRESLLHELEDRPDASRQSYSILLGTAFTGRPYARVCDAQKSGVEALTWSDMVAYARRAIVPDRLVLVLVGDLRGSQVMTNLEKLLGGFEAGNESHDRMEFDAGELSEAPGARRLQANTSRERRLLMAWRVPSLAHRDTPVLEVIVQLLGGGRTSRFIRSLVVEKHLAKSLSVKLGVPGNRETGLLVVEAEPEAEHALGELEQAIQSELMRFLQEVLTEEEIRRAQRQVEMAQMASQEDAGHLAEVLGAAQCSGGDWRLAFRSLQLHRDFTREEIRRAAQRYLIPAQSTTALLEPDPLLDPQDRQAARVLKVLTQLLNTRLQDPAQMEAVIRETLRQIRMLPAAEQEKTLKMLEGQVKP
jgi:zinc protease